MMSSVIYLLLLLIILLLYSSILQLTSFDVIIFIIYYLEGWMGFCESGTVKPWSGFTAQINTALKKALSVNSFARVEAWIERQEGARKIWIKARLCSLPTKPSQPEILYCEASGLFLKAVEQQPRTESDLAPHLHSQREVPSGAAAHGLSEKDHP
jgi:hypothetical protein